MTSSSIALFISVFLASAVEAVEAVTIVLAAGTARDWKSTGRGVIAGLITLAAIIGAFGPAISHLPISVLRVAVGGLTVISNHGQPAIQVAYIRPDMKHTSYLAGVAIMNASQISFVQHPGFSEPGQLEQLKASDSLAGGELVNLAATFNSAFKIKDSQGGYYQNGVTVKPLVAGKASFVIYKDGRADIGIWGSELAMTPDVVSVRQNLSPLIDQGQLSESLVKNVFVNWGFTVKNSYYVWRSGVGVTANGDIVYAAGNALSVQSLAGVLKAAGAVRAMELDINQQWISYMWYPPTTTGKESPIKLVAFTRPANRYLEASSRDFFAAYLK